MLIRRHCDDHQDESLSCCAQFENDLFAHAQKMISEGASIALLDVIKSSGSPYRNMVWPPRSPLFTDGARMAG
jgi:hypothetical protein